MREASTLPEVPLARSQDGRWRHISRWSIKARLAALVLALALPLNVLIVVAISQLAYVAVDMQRSSLQYTSRAVAMAIDAELGRFIGMAQSLANSPALLGDDLAEFAGEAKQELGTMTGAWVLVADLDGRQLYNSRAAPGASLPLRSPAALAAQRQAMERRAPTVSDQIWLGPIAQSYIATIEVPIFKDGQPFRSLAVVMTLGVFQRLLVNQQLPPGWPTGIIDVDGRFLARVPDRGQPVGQLASRGWREIKEREGIFEFASLEGTDLIQANAHPSLVRWSVGIAAERNQLRAATWEAVRWTAIPGFVLSALSLLLALVLARRITAPLSSLRRNLPALMQGLPVAMREAAPEIEEFKQALHRAGLERRTAEDTSLRLAAIVRSSFDAIISKSLDGTIRSWNASAEKMFGYSAVEALGRNIRMLVPEDRQHEEDDIVARLSRNEHTEPFETLRRHKDGQLIAVSLTVSPLIDADGRVTGASQIARDITERKAQEQQVQFLLRELSHRNKNLLAVIQSIAQRTVSTAPHEFLKAFMDRLHALAINQDLLASHEWRGVDLEALVKAQLQPFSDLAQTDIAMEGPPARLRAPAAQALGMALHELATNACKYGALSGAKGHIAVRWQLHDGNFELSWTETGGPLVAKPSRQGFGSIVLSTLVEQSLQGVVETDYAPTGLRWRITCPASQALEPQPSPAAAAS